MRKFNVCVLCIALSSFAWGQSYTSSIQCGWYIGYIPKWKSITVRDGSLSYYFLVNKNLYINSEASIESANFLSRDSTKSVLDNPSTSHPYSGLYFVLSSRLGRILINHPQNKLNIEAGLSVRKAYENYFFIYPSGEYGFYVNSMYQLGLSASLNHTYQFNKRIGINSFIGCNTYLFPFDKDLALVMLRTGVKICYNFNWKKLKNNDNNLND